MAQYIPKEPLVAEIERLQDAIKATAIDGRISKEQAEAYKVCVKLRSFVEDTLEVKEVDLGKELIEWHKEHFKKDGTFIGKSGFYLTNNSQMDIAKHFFELGLKAQKEGE